MACFRMVMLLFLLQILRTRPRMYKMKLLFPVLILVNLIMTNQASRIPRQAESCIKETEVFTAKEGRCVDFFDNKVCGFGERLYRNDDDLGECDCMEGFGRFGGSLVIKIEPGDLVMVNISTLS